LLLVEVISAHKNKIQSLCDRKGRQSLVCISELQNRWTSIFLLGVWYIVFQEDLMPWNATCNRYEIFPKRIVATAHLGLETSFKGLAGIVL